jgi:alkylated DNA repair protein alkB family protein 6
MPHEDGPLHFPNIATLTLGSHTVIEFRRKPQPEPASDSASDQPADQPIRVLLEPNSLFIVRGSLYRDYLHGIANVGSDVITPELANLAQCQATEGDVLTRSTRVSLTMRRVLRVSKLNTSLLLGKRR